MGAYNVYSVLQITHLSHAVGNDNQLRSLLRIYYLECLSTHLKITKIKEQDGIRQLTKKLAKGRLTQEQIDILEFEF